MSVDFRTRSVAVPVGKGPRTIADSVVFDSDVRRASVVLNGFKLNFVDGDKHINIVEADTDLVSISGPMVRFQVQCDYRDKDVDDDYSGYVTATVIADVG
ncbi:MAG: hypothetical protein AAGA65_29235 [Actinomycetota bacterium]